MPDVAELFVMLDTSIRDVIARIDRGRIGMALVVDADNRLLAAITDGDVRRGLLAGVGLDAQVAQLLDTKGEATPRLPITAPAGTPQAALLELMNRHDLRQVPLVDHDGRVVGIELLTNLVNEYQLPLRALVMAGGYGTRLHPLTAERPKSMLPVGDKPLLEVIVDQLQQAGIRRVSLATHYKAEMIEQHFGDGRDFGVDIAYINEDEPLGTAGALSRMPPSDEPILVMNGDILSRVNLAAMLEFHRSHAADMTVAVRPYEFQVPYGVIKSTGISVTAVEEKPVISYNVNAGIYLLNDPISRLVPGGERFDMTDLIARAIAGGHKVVSFLLREAWIDIGRRDDYTRAQADFGGAERGSN